MLIASLFILGLLLGSFVNALVWRLHKKRNFVSERSECTHCHHVLAWYDLIPVLSWLWLRGRCRYCKKSIDDSPLVELGVATSFALSYAWWPFGWSPGEVVLFGLWLLSLVLLAALLLYDLKWMLLPNKLVFPLIGLGGVWTVVSALLAGHQAWSTLLNAGLGVVAVAGLYGSLYGISKGAWIGFGDVKLGIFMGLVLGWQGGLLAIILANLMAFLVVLPGLISGKITRTSKIPFGPFLIIATFLAFLIGESLIAWSISFMLMI